jgi:hypothetical protein
VSGGYFHTCAMKQSGAVFCIGEDTTGQLGDGANNVGPGKLTQVALP